MAIPEISGSDFLDIIASDTENDEAFFLRSYLSFGLMALEDWDTQPFDSESSNQSGRWKSLQGSAISFRSSGTGSDTAGSNTGSIAVVGKPDGITISGTWSNTWVANYQKNQKNISWRYQGDPKTTSDDYAYKLIYLSKHSDAPGVVNSESINLDFSNAQWRYKWNASVSGNDIAYRGSGSMMIVDESDSTSLSMSINAIVDTTADKVNITLSNVKYILSDYSIITAKYTEILSVAVMKALSQISPDNDIDLNTIKGGIPDFVELFTKGNNAITITSTTGVTIDGGAGNDTIKGAVGDDTLIAGAGKDNLTGGKGNDIFILKKDDYDFTSEKTVQADKITDFQYVENGEQDSITLDGFGDIAVFKTTAAAKTAKSTAEVIYESSTGRFWYNEDHDTALAGILNFASVKILTDYLAVSGWQLN